MVRAERPWGGPPSRGPLTIWRVTLAVNHQPHRLILQLTGMVGLARLALVLRMSTRRFENDRDR